MNPKKEISFFLLSFSLSFGLWFTAKKYYDSFITSDLIAYGLVILLVAIVPLLFNVFWSKINKVSFFALYLFIVLLLSKIFFIVDIGSLKHFLIEHRLSLVSIFVCSFVVMIFVKKNFKNAFFKKIYMLISNFYTYPVVKLLANLLVFFLIFFLIYNPRYKFSMEKLSFFGYESFHAYHHITFFLAPIHEILSGKTLLVNVASQYGIFSTYINSLIFKVAGLSYPNFVLFNMVSAIVYTGIFFIILKKVTKSFWLALIGTLAYIRLAFFRDFSSNVEVFIYPSTTPIRHFFDILVFYLIFDYFQHKFNLKKLLILSTIVSFSFFYNFDFGLFILIAYIITLIFDIFLSVYHRKKLQKVVLKLDLYILTLVVPFIFFGLSLIIGSYLRSGVFPDLNNYIFHISTQTVQLSDRSFPRVIGWQHLPLLVYLVAFYYVFYHNIVKKRADNYGLVFLLIYGLLTFTFYINLSEPNHLFPFLNSSVIIFMILLKNICCDLNHLKKNSLVFLLVITFFFGILWAIFMYPRPFMKLIVDRINSRYLSFDNNYYYWDYPHTNFYLRDDDGQKFKLAVDKIKQYADTDKEVVIISRYSSLLYLMSGKTSLIDHPNIEYDIYSIQEFSKALNKIKISRPKYIFVHSTVYSQWYIDIMDSLWNGIKGNYSLKEDAGAIDVYQLKNN